MTVQELGSVGELIAAIATIATLFYLARQVRANTRQAQTACRVEITRDFRTMHSALFDTEIMYAWAAGLREYPDLPFKERELFSVQLANQALTFQGVFAQFENGQLEDETYKAYLAYFSGLVATPGSSKWWEAIGRPIFIHKMVEVVDHCVASGAFPDMLQNIYRMPEAGNPQ